MGPTSVLYVDDEGYLLELAKIFLERSGEFAITTCENAVDAIRLLSDESFDAIISDYQMPGMDGIQFLKHLREDGDETPFIIFTGKGREDVVIEALNSGADFYLQKGGAPKSQFVELAKKIQYAVARKRSEIALRESESRLRFMLGFYEMAREPEKELLLYAVEGAGSVTGSPLGYLAFLNADESELSMYAWSQKAMQECSIREKPIVYPVETTGLWGEAIRQRRPVITNDYEAPNPKKKGYPEGHPRIIRHMNVPVMDGNRIVMVAGVANKPSDYLDDDVRQLTLMMQGLWQVLKRRRIEDALRDANEQLVASDEALREQNAELARSGQRFRESESRFRQLAEATVEGIVLHKGGVISDLNERACELFRYSRSEMIGRDVLTLAAPDSSELVRQKIAEGFEKPYEAKGLRKDGSTFWAELRSRNFASGSETFRITTLWDITERKDAENALRESEAALSSIFRAAPIGIGLVSDRILLRVNDRLCQMTGYRPDELVGQSARILYPSDEDFDFVGREKYGQIKKYGTGTVETRWKQKNGSIRDILLSSTPLDPADPAKGVTFTALDITERKKAEEELAASEERYRIIVETANEGIWVINADFVTTFTNRKMREILGYGAGEMLGHPAWDFVPPGDVESMKESLFERRSGKPGRYERRWQRKDGVVVWCMTSATPLFSPEGVFIGSFGMFTDNTERRQTEKALRESEVKYRSLVETTNTGFVIIDGEGRVIDANDEYIRLTGRATLAEIAGREVIEWTAPSERERNAEAINRCINDGYIRNFEIDYVDPAGRIIPIEINATVLRLENGPQILTLCRDISERRQVQETLRESEEKYRTLVQQSQDGVFIVQDDRLVFYNQALSAMTGYDKTELIGRFISEFIVPEDRQKVMARHHERVDGRPAPASYEFSVLHKDGSSRVRVRMHAGMATYRGRPATIGTFHNITEDRKREEALRESEERFRRLISQSFDAVVVHQDGKVVLANESAARIIGASSPERLVGHSVTALVHPDFRGTVEHRIREMLQKEEDTVPPIEERFIRLDGSSVDVEVMGTATHYEGRPAVMVVFRDISDRKRAEDELRLITHNMVDLVTRIDRERRVIYSSPSAERLTGHSAADLIGHDVTEFIHPDDRKRVIEETHAAVEKHLPSVRVEYRYRTKNGEYRWFESETRILYDAQGRYDGAIFTVRDITGRREIETALRESEKRYRTVIENIEDGFFRTDREGLLVMVSPSAVRMAGYTSTDDVIGLPILSIYRDPATRNILLEKMRTSGYIRDYEIELKRKDGRVFWGSISAHYLYDENGMMTGTEGMIRDITERKHMENALRLANRKLLLLGSTSRHDIINQLTVLRGYLDLLEIQHADPSESQLYDRIKSAAQRIASILEFTREYEKIGVMAPVWTDIRELVTNAAGQAIPPGITITCDIPAGYEVFADPMIARVFYNLLDNAVRYGKTITSIRFSMTKTADGCTIVCEDDGAGIPLHEKEKIFTKGFGKGTGLGLFLAREILAITGIAIRETGEPGKGARFEMAVPEGMFRAGTS
ncbi:MAG: PAS domain S-box protein [Methanomicrobiales archaeon]|nr:PAS domain S-box protein [Methanomicrobiales archaeon]